LSRQGLSARDRGHLKRTGVDLLADVIRHDRQVVRAARLTGNQLRRIAGHDRLGRIGRSSRQRRVVGRRQRRRDGCRWQQARCQG
jgi:hypothetical protein